MTAAPEDKMTKTESGPVVPLGQLSHPQAPPTGGTFTAADTWPRILPRRLSRLAAIYCVDTADPVIGLSYDDGPHPEHTPRILDLLAERGLHASFYVLSRHVRQFPDVARRIVADGHEIQLHGDTHDSLLTMSVPEAVRRMRRARTEVEDVIGREITWFRPPYGAHTAPQVAAIRAVLGLPTVVWSSDAKDWIDDEIGAIVDRALAGVFSGGVLLLHDNRGDPHTLRAGERLPNFDKAAVLAGVLDRFAAQGLAVRTVGELISSYPPVRRVAPIRAPRRL
ncbi:polysaccharide deacetylase family protein [Microlunatus endophyticus]|uniref:polysaccharide deacetylase family protein n=1 Tax=Microlunatus endophyticus TaxID=1716077 RepID=UPI0016690BF4|nr:polysaccharide deacetylase family protein [Microlunatus endophyticus]